MKPHAVFPGGGPPRAIARRAIAVASAPARFPGSWRIGMRTSPSPTWPTAAPGSGEKEAPLVADVRAERLAGHARLHPAVEVSRIHGQMPSRTDRSKVMPPARRLDATIQRGADAERHDRHASLRAGAGRGRRPSVERGKTTASGRPGAFTPSPRPCAARPDRAVVARCPKRSLGRGRMTATLPWAFMRPHARADPACAVRRRYPVC